MNDYDTPEIRCSLRNLSRVTEWYFPFKFIVGEIIGKGAINIINIFFALTCKTCKAHNYISINVTLKLYGYQNFLPSVSCFHDDSASDSTI